MNKTYNPAEIEQHWYHIWEDRGYFAANAAQNAEPYCIMIPPPNVTGTLHMGHAFQHTLMDILIRYQRMQGKNTLWQAGTDHAGIATQMVVERQLNAEGKTRHDLGREKFIERVWNWKEESGGTISKQMRRLGDSPDWSRERFTMDEGLSKAVNSVFEKLFDEGLIYRGQRLVNWDPVLHTAVSDLEVVSEEENGFLWEIRYPLANASGHLIVATTRPETMLGDTAVAVHPDDERYQHLIGQTVKLPLTDREIPIIADDYVDPEFGTGCVKITPAHDFNDYAVGQRHQLPMINIFTADAKINDIAPKTYQGMDRYDARKQIIKDLAELDLLASAKDHKLMVPRGDRTGAAIEPYLTDQWFVKTAPLAKPAIRAVEEGRIRFVPENWKKTYDNWMLNIEDWCISRQIWWGHRVPAWYDADGGIYVGQSESEVRQKYGLKSDLALKQDNDVLDTWFSSALWPFSTLGWPDKTPELKTWYPTQVLVTGFDIIFFWVARMIMMGLKFMDNEVPFKEVYITGLIRDEHGQKMSKSKGNILDPLDLIDGISLEDLVQKRTAGLMQPQMAAKIEKSTRKEFPNGIPAFGTDALRFTLASLASTGRDIRFDLQRMEGYRNFCNKLWNAARYVLMNTEGQDTGINNETVELSLADRWIIAKLQTVEASVRQHLDHYRFDLASKEIYEFTWNEYCDWYIELSKPVLLSDKSTAEQLRGTRRTLVRVLETLLRLSHPFIPFITETIWQTVAPLTYRAEAKADSIMLCRYPVPDTSKHDDHAIETLEWVKTFIMGVRRIRSEMDIAPGKPLPVLLQGGSEQDRNRLEKNTDFISTLSKLESITWLDKNTNAPESAIALVGELKILIPLAGLIDKDAERARLTKEIEKIQITHQRTADKLSNPEFTGKAPAAVVEKEQQKLKEMEAAIAQLNIQLKKLEAL